MKKIILMLLVLMMIMPLANAAVDPIPKCDLVRGDAIVEVAQVGTYDNALKFDNWDDLNYWVPTTTPGVYTRAMTKDGNTIVIFAYLESISDGKAELVMFDWTSTVPVGVVIAVDGNVCPLVYIYNPPVKGDNGLYASLEPLKAISHVSFGWDDGEVMVPEFPTVALPIAAILGLAFVFMRRKN